MNKRGIVLVMLLLAFGGLCFEVNAAYMGYTGTVKNEISLKAVKTEIRTYSLSGSNAEKAASSSNAQMKASAGNAERAEYFNDRAKTVRIRE